MCDPYLSASEVSFSQWGVIQIQYIPLPFVPFCYQLLLKHGTDNASSWMQKLWLRSERDGNAAVKPRQKDGHRSHSVDSDFLLRPKTKSKTKSPSRKSTKVVVV